MTEWETLKILGGGSLNRVLHWIVNWVFIVYKF